MSHIATKTIKAGINAYTFSIEPIRDEILNELYYIVSWQDFPFIMAYDNDRLQLTVQGAAPYIARILETELGSYIEGLEL